MQENDTVYHLRLKLEETYGWDASAFILSQVLEKNVIRMMNCETLIKDVG